eukprot:scaffold4982_cov92-Skeletonema_dohrnii-CCMP3373.AAC.13
MRIEKPTAGCRSVVINAAQHLLLLMMPRTTNSRKNLLEKWSWQLNKSGIVPPTTGPRKIVMPREKFDHNLPPRSSYVGISIGIYPDKFGQGAPNSVGIPT